MHISAEHLILNSEQTDFHLSRLIGVLLLSRSASKVFSLWEKSLRAPHVCRGGAPGTRHPARDRGLFSPFSLFGMLLLFANALPNAGWDPARFLCLLYLCERGPPGVFSDSEKKKGSPLPAEGGRDQGCEIQTLVMRQYAVPIFIISVNFLNGPTSAGIRAARESCCSLDALCFSGYSRAPECTASSALRARSNCERD